MNVWITALLSTCNSCIGYLAAILQCLCCSPFAACSLCTRVSGLDIIFNLCAISWQLFKIRPLFITSMLVLGYPLRAKQYLQVLPLYRAPIWDQANVYNSCARLVGCYCIIHPDNIYNCCPGNQILLKCPLLWEIRFSGLFRFRINYEIINLTDIW
jgi:hypothetical protein